MKPIKLNSSNLLYLGICLLGTVAFFFVGIYPNTNSLREINDEIASLNQKVSTQELLFPVYLELLTDITHTIPTKLPVPESEVISHNELGQLNDTFLKLAGECNVLFVNAVADASNYLDDKGRLSMTATFTGDFFDLRQLILKICQLPYMESIDAMQIKTLKNRKQIKFIMKVSQT